MTREARLLLVKACNSLVLSIGLFAQKLGTAMQRALAAIDHYQIRAKPEYYQEFKIGKQLHKRYSMKALEAIQEGLQTEALEEIWEKRRTRKAA